jgi:hypothetical protein
MSFQNTEFSPVLMHNFTGVNNSIQISDVTVDVDDRQFLNLA